MKLQAPSSERGGSSFFFGGWGCGSPQRVIGADTLSFNAKVDLVNSPSQV